MTENSTTTMVYRHGGQERHLPTAVLRHGGVTCLYSNAVFQFNFSAVLTVLCPEIPHERQAAKTLCARLK